MTGAATSGFLLGGSLIVAIGAQNAFVLRQGLRREYVFVVCLVCALSDALLIAAGVAGMGTLVQQSPLLLRVATFGGAAFLFVYGLMAFRRAMRPQALQAAGGTVGSLASILGTCLALTFLNPHVYLDTVVLVGSLSAQYPGALRWAFGAGAMAASVVWFFGLGYGARLLAPTFANPKAWRVLDALIGATMWGLALLLLLSLD